ncbi:unnamed protein product [Cyberlindnera jadinii]|nr:unnamed protein product [Cyberlindnera jadinii]
MTVRTLTVTDAHREHQRLLDENGAYEQDLAEQKSKVQALEDNVSMLQRRVRNLANEKEKLNAVVTKLTDKLNSQTEEYHHKNKSIEVLNDEFLSMQIQNNLLHDRLATLEKENDQLVQRWLAKAQEDADRINAMLEG